MDVHLLSEYLLMSLFDSQTGKLIDPLALKSLNFIAFQPTSKIVAVDREKDTQTTTVIDQDSGRVMGIQTHHGSGRLDANAFPLPAKVTKG